MNDACAIEYLARATILIVEDHDGIRRLLREWLGDAFPQNTLRDVATGEEAVALAATELPGLVLMDIQLPKMNGIEATRQIKALSPRSRVVMLSSMDNVALRIAASAAGASAYVSKHGMRTDLIPVIEAMNATLGAEDLPASPGDP